MGKPVCEGNFSCPHHIIVLNVNEHIYIYDLYVSILNVYTASMNVYRYVLLGTNDGFLSLSVANDGLLHMVCLSN